MQAAHGAFPRRDRLVILHAVEFDAGGRQIAAAEGLADEPARVGVARRNDPLHVWDGKRQDLKTLVARRRNHSFTQPDFAE